jgi:hypothetical protein
MGTVSTTIGRKRLGLAMAALCLWAGFGTAQAGALWYNGDYDGNPAGPILNAVIPGSGMTQAFVYQEFIVPAGQTWTIQQAYSNDYINTDAVTSAHWEIVSNVIPTVGATVVASGYGSATQVKIAGSSHDYTVTVSGLNVMLSAGTYWLSVTPVVGKNHEAYLLSTAGTNGTGVVTGNAGSSFVDGSYYANNGNPPFDYASNVSGENPVGFSMGVNGISVASVPEPSTLVMGLIGTLTMLGYTWHRRRLHA